MASSAVGVGATPSSPFGALADGPNMGAGPDPIQEQLTQMMGQIRDVASQVDQIAAANPAVQQEATQIRALLRQMVVKTAQSAPMQTASSEMVPTAGM